MDYRYYPSTGFVTDITNDEEEVSYCISKDGDDILIGKKIVEKGEVVEDVWLVTMNKATFEKLIAGYNDHLRQNSPM